MGMTEAGIGAWLRTEWLGRKMHCLEQIDSTNLEAVRLAAEGAPDGTVVTSEAQSAGVGRRGRSWNSPAIRTCVSVRGWRMRGLLGSRQTVRGTLYVLRRTRATGGRRHDAIGLGR